MKRRSYMVITEQNGGEYIGFTKIECESLSKDLREDNVVIADNVRIEFDERIVRIEGEFE